MYYRDHLGQLCYDDGTTDWICNDDGTMQPADWFWYAP